VTLNTTFDVNFPVYVEVNVDSQRKALSSLGILPSEFVRLLEGLNGWGYSEYGLQNLQEQSRLIDILAQEVANKAQVVSNMSNTGSLQLRFVMEDDLEKIDRNCERIYKATEAILFLYPVLPTLLEVTKRAQEGLANPSTPEQYSQRMLIITESVAKIARSVEVMNNFVALCEETVAVWIRQDVHGRGKLPIGTEQMKRLKKVKAHLFGDLETEQRGVMTIFSELKKQLTA
jgi:hypothetical protein